MSIDEKRLSAESHNTHPPQNNYSPPHHNWYSSLPAPPPPTLTSPADKERQHLERVCASFRQYATFARCARRGRAARITALPPASRAVLPRWMLEGTPESAERDKVMAAAELRNQFFFDSALRHAGFPHSQEVGRPGDVEGNEWATDDEMDKVQSVLKSLSRDWSKEGLAERAMSYQDILNGLKKYIPPTEKIGWRPPRVCVPGAGLGRLALEIYAMGYEVQGNEFSLHMLLASDFVLNGCTTQHPFEISPWLGSTKNVCRAADPARTVTIPDVDPSSVMTPSGESALATSGETDANLPDFSMAAGEFVSIYSKPEEKGKWQGVASCFFLDTAPNVVDYLKVIYDMLEDGGILINFGPLLFHWSGPPVRPDDGSFEQYLLKNKHLDQRYLESVDMSWEDVREVLWRVGFNILEHKVGLKARYTADLRSFMNTDYRCIYFVAQKVTKRDGQPPPSMTD